jgi:hypothetical protein
MAGPLGFLVGPVRKVRNESSFGTTPALVPVVEKRPCPHLRQLGFLPSRAGGCRGI